MSDHDFRSINDNIDVRYNLYVFDTRYQKNIDSAQPNK